MDSYLLLIDESEPQNQPNLWTPADISLAYFYSAESSDNFTFSSGTVISQWDDLSGNNYHLTISSGSDANYDSSNKKVVLDNSTNLVSSYINTSGELTYFIGLNDAEGNNSNSIFGLDNSYGDFDVLYDTSGYLKLAWNTNTAHTTTTTYGDGTNSGAFCFAHNANWISTSSLSYDTWNTVITTSQKYNIRVSGVDAGNIGSSGYGNGSFNIRYLYLNGSTRFSPTNTKIEVEAVLGVLDQSIDEDIIEKIEGWWAHTFNHTDKLPIGHPYKDNAPTK